MKSIQSIVRPIAVALVFALSAIPMTAFAGDKAPVTETKKPPRFPMTAESFNKLIENRIAKIRERLSEKLAKHKVPEAKQAEIKKDFEAGAAAIRAAAAKAAADGTVTKEEAKDVRRLAKDIRRQAREKYMPGKGHGKEHGKGHGKDHEKKSDDVG